MTVKTKRWRRVRWTERRETKRQKRAHPQHLHRLLARWNSSPIEIVSAPSRLHIYPTDDHRLIARFLRELRESFARPGITTVIDLRATNKVLPGGALLFYAELHRLIHIFPSKAFKFIKSITEVVNEICEHLEIFSLSNYFSGTTPKRDDVVTWGKASSAITDGEPAGQLIEAYEAALSRAEIRHIFRGVTEAATNAVEHAYSGDRDDDLPTYDESRWWMFCRETEKRLFVAIADLGIGIPRSLPKTFGEEVIAITKKALSLGTSNDDATMIRAAMELARTRTEKEERGKGLGDMRRVVDELEGSELYIFSNSGLVTYSAGKYTQRTYPESILGTLVIWIVPIEGE